MLRALSKHSTRLLRKFTQDERGVGAIEFAFIFPLLVILYLGAFELTVAYSVYKRTATAAGSIADTISQQSSVDKAFLGSMKNLINVTFTPYKPINLKLKITGILVDDKQFARVLWSWDETGAAPYGKNTTVNLPESMRDSARFYIRTELEVDHSILRFMTTLETAITPVTLSRDYMFEKRPDDPVLCPSC